MEKNQVAWAAVQRRNCLNTCTSKVTKKRSENLLKQTFIDNLNVLGRINFKQCSDETSQASNVSEAGQASLHLIAWLTHRSILETGLWPGEQFFGAAECSPRSRDSCRPRRRRRGPRKSGKWCRHLPHSLTDPSTINFQLLWVFGISPSLSFNRLRVLIPLHKGYM